MTTRKKAIWILSNRSPSSLMPTAMTEKPRPEAIIQRAPRLLPDSWSQRALICAPRARSVTAGSCLRPLPGLPG